MKPYGKVNRGSGNIHSADKCDICSETKEPNPKRERTRTKKEIEQQLKDEKEKN